MIISSIYVRFKNKCLLRKKLNAHCKFDNNMEIFGSALLAGYTLGCVTVNRFGDVIGRKPVLTISLFLLFLIMLLT